MDGQRDHKGRFKKYEWKPIKLSGNRLAIPLLNGGETIIDAEDYDRVKDYGWRKDRNSYVFSPFTKNGKNGSRNLPRIIMHPSDDLHVDHIDNNPLNNCKQNLRLCTHAQNMMNRKITGRGSSKYKGVSKQGYRWVARIKANCKLYYLGIFKSEDEAAKAYNKGAVKYHGEFANLNEIKG